MQGVVDSLANKPVEVNRAAQELHMALLQEGFIPVVNKMKGKYRPEGYFVLEVLHTCWVGGW